jgi:hypothetical protein
LHNDRIGMASHVCGCACVVPGAPVCRRSADKQRSGLLSVLVSESDPLQCRFSEDALDSVKTSGLIISKVGEVGRTALVPANKLGNIRRIASSPPQSGWNTPLHLHRTTASLRRQHKTARVCHNKRPLYSMGNGFIQVTGFPWLDVILPRAIYHNCRISLHWTEYSTQCSA